MTTRRRFLLASAAGAIAPHCVLAQTRPVKIGVLSPRPLATSSYSPGVIQRLAELGYREGAGMIFEFRSAGGAEGFPKLARELTDLKCDVIFAMGPEQTVRALQDARSPVPVVFLAVDYDPVGKGVVGSLRNPDRNTTGVYVPQNELVAKRLEIMREVVPRARSFLALADVFSRDQIDPVSKAAEAARVQLSVIEFSKQPYDFVGAFEAGRKAKAEALIGLSSPVFAANEAAISALLLKYRLPGIGATLSGTQAGYLLGYTADIAKVSRRAAEIGARILKGAKPADIPVEQADEFELLINSKTARALGVSIPESVRARATRIIQ
jgi:ABC-type uncharacterized transport system substrate-binding protein